MFIVNKKMEIKIQWSYFETIVKKMKQTTLLISKPLNKVENIKTWIKNHFENRAYANCKLIYNNDWHAQWKVLKTHVYTCASWNNDFHGKK